VGPIRLGAATRPGGDATASVPKTLGGKLLGVVISLSILAKSRHLLDMPTRRATLGLALGAWTLELPGAAAAPRTTLQQLFRIERSKNENVVRYAARCIGAELDTARPVDAYWVMLAEDGRREELTWAERRLAYGFQVEGAGPTSCRLRLVAFDQRPVTIERGAQGFTPWTTLSGRRGVLERIFVQADEHALLPRVKYLDLFGRSSDGLRLRERIVA
jgi:hypothetical protein